ncbi:2-isopropylmalate synthase [Gluconobacter wancherniae]|uniref:2-isopropylmalate synthase n=1 Tax=Gluconobacter wancherniae NBRC 103581 TaxID=656744 RepID=A0A511AWT5_9PROT|nr:2-isopropylmalate synthase [Gluconobacter wancherniae]MBF0852793.1 2-isopropylmalate synthase [Gluconobacter wancherniae]GBD56493.1 2-isopropylmalate synthase [Gluconobacter wancherniae NBRC 103581]GBR63976.1 2-isopropylmalate synthase [Gluconobacter wancherniae NBRC 103581]GEK92606.1 2-isopropylmalate synthase [Gluconobacter wancherniae NBRC 103581]
MTFQHPSFGNMADDRVIIFDTTLRDGEQSPGFSMNIEEKLRMAHALSGLGVDVIEAGFPVASEGDFESVRRIAEEVRGSVICGLARSGGRRDIEAAGDALKKAERSRIHNFISTSPLHMKYKLRMEPETVLEIIASGNQKARQYTDDVEWSAEDGSRTDPDFLCRCVEVAIRNGANTINIPDTVGFATPEEMRAIFKMLMERVPGADKVIFSAHNHNDLGLGVANTLASVEGGARQIECTINGIGERAGNAALEEIVMALRTRHDQYNRVTGIETTKLLSMSRMLATITGFDVQPNKAIVGRNAFAHESGIHQDGILKNAATYEIMTPESVGWNKTSLVMGKHSGRAAFRDKLASMGYPVLEEEALNAAFARFKDLADRKKVVFDDDIRELVDDESRDHDRIHLVSLELTAGTKESARVKLEISVDGAIQYAAVSGNGPVDAAFRAIGEAFPHTATLALFSVANVTEGTDAQARTTVRLLENGKLVDGQGADSDTVVSAVRAYIHALNKLLTKRERTEPEALVS